MEDIISFYSWLDIWLDTYKKAQVKKQTYENSKYYVKMVKENAYDIIITDISEIYCQNILNAMGDKGYAKGTIQKVRCIICQSVFRAFKNKVIHEDCTTELIIPRMAPIKEVAPLTIEEQRIIENACRTCTNGDFTIFLLYTGLRREEFVELKWTDFSEKKIEIHIRKSKTSSGIRTVPLVKKALDILLKQPKIDEYIFHNADGSHVSDSSLKKLYERIRVKTGIDSFTNHVCRHTFATRLIEKGASPKSVATLLGHKKVEYALDIYTQLGKEHLKKEIFLLENKVG